MSVQQEPSYALKMLGAFELRRSGAPIAVPTRKLACLLAYLAYTAPAPQSRERLANLLWGAHSEVRARHNLRQALLRLRQLLGHDAITSNGETVLLTPGAVACDAARFVELLREESETSIAAAADLYRGALLENVSVRDVGWNEWLLRERYRLGECAVGAIVAQGERSLARGDAEGAVRCGRRAVAIDDFREDAHRLVLKALAAAGRNSEALRHYQDLVALLKAELGAEPDAKTNRLAGALGRGRSPSGSDAAAGAEPSPSDCPSPTVPHAGKADAAIAGALPGAAQEPASSPGAVRLDGAERRQVTFLVCHAEPSLSHPAPIDPEDMRDLILAFRKTAADTVASFGGQVIANPGATVHACFGYPQTREQDAVQAVRASMALVQAAQALGAASAIPLQAKVGVAAGLVVVGEDLGPDRGGGPVMIGEAPALAEQLQAWAGPGEIIASRETRPLLEPRFELRPSQPLTPRGAARPLEGWLVSGEADGLNRWKREMRAPLVGRQEEFDLLLRRWDQAKQGDGRVVLLSGEPGIGKSYIAEHLTAALEKDQPARLRYLCSPHHAMRPLHPYIRQLERSAALSLASTSEEKLDRLAALIGPTSTNVVRDVALLAELLALPLDARYPVLTESPPRKRELLMTAYLEILEGLAARRPVLALFEDIHWIDPTSLDLLDRTIARIARLPVLLIATFRPEHQAAWVGQPHVTLLHLSRLGRRDSAALVGEVARDTPLPQPVVDQIVDHTDGVPLFITEVSKHLLESGLLDDHAGDGVAGPLPPLPIPMTLQGALSVRLEGLGDAKTLALLGSAIGRTFSHELAAALVGADFTGLDEALDRLKASGFVTRRGTPPDASYAFTHALGRDAAYEMIRKNQRRPLHSKIADVMIDRFATRPEGLPEMVAHHLSHAGRTSEAIGYWVAASRSARARWANRECAGFLDLALRAIDELPRTPSALRQAIDLLFDMKNALIPLGEFDRAVGCLVEARALIEQLDDPRRLCQFQVHMCQALGLSGNANEAIAFGQDAERLAESLGDPRLLVEATVFLATAHFTVMDYPQADRLFLQVLQLLEGKARGGSFALAAPPEITARAFLTRISAVRGEFDQGIRYGEAAVRQAEDLQQPYSLGISIWCLADLHLTRGDVAQATGLFERGLAVSRNGDLPFLVAGHSASLGHAYSLTNRVDEGLPLLEQAMGVFEKMQHQLALSLFRIPLGEAYVLAGRFDQAADLATRALTLAGEIGQRGAEAGPRLILADVAAHTGRLEQAEGLYREALTLAETLGMRPLATRCRDRLATVNASRAPTVTRLAPI